MGTSRLQIYNRALQMAGERALANLSEDVEGRRLLDNVWNNGGVNLCLEAAQWAFAMRTVRIDYDPDVNPSFGYTYAFSKPDDWILTSAVCADEFFRVPLTRYYDEAGYWYSDINQIYVRYVSNDTAYGFNYGIWPESFTEFVAAHFATQIILKLSDEDSRYREFINPDNPKHSVRGRALEHAKSRCAMAGPPQFMAPGNWTRARQSGMQRRDGGSSSNLIG